MTQNGQFHLICNFSNLFPPKWLRMTRNGQFHPIRNFSHLFPPKWLKMTRNGQFCPICNFSNLFPPKWLRMTQNGQFCLIRNFSNFFPPKWLRMTWNGQFCMAKIKYTLIQGNFYERLLFYMDSCALSPMASLLCFVSYFRGQMISQEDYNFITRLDNSSPEQRIQLLKEKSYQVINKIELVDENMGNCYCSGILYTFY